MTNKVELLGYYGDDNTHACSAWTSTSRDLSEEKINRIPKLLKMLADEGHHTPFEKSYLHFLVTTDIASHIHIIKHRIGVSVNGESARYKELKEDKYYLPEDWKDILVDKKHHNMNYISNQVDSNWGSVSWMELLDNYTRIGNALYHKALEDLTSVLGRKRASYRTLLKHNHQILCDK